MRIRRLLLKNIGVFDEEEIEFKPCASGQAEIHILTGPNGCGKTTILMAMSEVFSGNAAGQVPQSALSGSGICYLHKSIHQNELLRKRLRGNGSQPDNIRVDFDTPIGAAKILVENGLLVSYDDTSQLNQYRILANGPIEVVRSEITPFLPFADSGYRFIAAEPIDAIREQKVNPLAGALDFIKDNSRNNRLIINQWIANNLSKSAWEERKNNATKAARFAAAIRSLEDAITKIIGYKIEFDLDTDPTALLVKANGQNLDFDVLPDGLRSLISWMGDLLMRVDSLKWQDDLPAFEKNLILFLDEIEVHLHPAWQRKVLPVVQKLFKNSQIFLSTHSPFVVNSVDGAWVYELDFKENGSAYVKDVRESKSSNSIQNVLRTVFDVTEQYGEGTQKELEDWQAQRDAILQGESIDQADFLKRARALAARGLELSGQIEFELLQLSNLTGENYEL
jgi:predicted ATP-binding protein involved in virulence